MNDLITTDISGYTSISGLETKELVTQASPATERGMLVFSADTALDTPVVPDANTTTKFQRYLWIRKLFNSGRNRVYVWSPFISDDATFLKWIDVQVTSIPPFSLNTNKLGEPIISDKFSTDNYWNLITGKPTSWTQIGNVVPGLNSSLAGTYPNPVVRNSSVTPAMINDDAGMKIVQYLTGSAASARLLDASATTAFQIPFGSAPTTSKGFLATGSNFTPRALTNKLEISSNLLIAGEAATDVVVIALFIGNTLVYTTIVSAFAQGTAHLVPIKIAVDINTYWTSLTSQLVSLRVGPTGATTIYINRSRSTDTPFGASSGTILNTNLTLTEYRP